MSTTTLKLKDRYSGNPVWLTIRDGVVVGAMGTEPKRYMGMTTEIAKRYARVGGSAQRDLSAEGAASRAERRASKYSGVRPGGKNDI